MEPAPPCILSSMRVALASTVLLLAAAAVVLFLGMRSDEGEGGAAASLRVAPGWQRLALTPDECLRAGATLDAARDAMSRPAAPSPAQAAELDASGATALVRQWFDDEYEKAKRWVAAGCPDDGIRGLYVPEGAEGREGELRLFEYPDAGSWAAANGVELPAEGQVVIVAPVYEAR